MKDKISIREVTKSMNLTTRALRYYEELGIIDSAQIGRGNRCYTKESLKKLVYLQELKNKGCTLKEIEEFMGDRCCNQKEKLFEEKIRENKAQIEYLIWQNSKITEEMEIIKKLNVNNFNIEIKELEAEYFSKSNEKSRVKTDNTVEKIWRNEEYNMMEEEVSCLSEENFHIKNYGEYNFNLFKNDKKNDYEIPKGKYIVAYSRNGIEKQEEVFENISEYIFQNRLIVEGNLYVWNKFRIFCKKEKKIITITKSIIKIKKLEE